MSNILITKAPAEFIANESDNWIIISNSTISVYYEYSFQKRQRRVQENAVMCLFLPSILYLQINPAHKFQRIQYNKPNIPPLHYIYFFSKAIFFRNQLQKNAFKFLVPNSYTFRSFGPRLEHDSASQNRQDNTTGIAIEGGGRLVYTAALNAR